MEGNRFARSLVGLIVAAVGLFALVSVLTHSAFDPSPAPNFPVNDPAANLCGRAGAYLSWLLIWAHGLGAYLLPVVVLGWGIGEVGYKGDSCRIKPALGGALLVLTVTVAARVVEMSGVDMFTAFASSKSIPGAGGRIGALVGGGLVNYLGLVGPYIVILLSLAGSAVLISKERTEQALGIVGGLIMTVVGLRPWRKAKEESALSEDDVVAITKGPLRRAPDPVVEDEEDEEEIEEDEDEEAMEEEENLAPIIRVAGGNEESAARAAEAEKLADKLGKELEKERAKEAKRKKSKGEVEAERMAALEAELEAGSKADDLGVNLYQLPPIEMLEEGGAATEVTSEELTRRGAVLVQMLREFRIETKLVAIDRGPTVTLFELELAPGIKVQQVLALSDNIAMSMKAMNVRIVAPIPGRSTIGVEIPNAESETVNLRPIIESPEFSPTDFRIPVILGRDSSGTPLVYDLTRMPHLLIAGATGSGKSVCINSIIIGILMHRDPTEVKLLLVDPKMVEMTSYKAIPHLISPIVNDMKRAAGVLEWAVKEMESRYRKLNELSCRDIVAYNRFSPEERVERIDETEDPEPFRARMPYIVIIVDELADLMMVASKEIEASITRLAQKSRSVGIHIVLATQRPSVDVITGLIKANMPARVAFQVTSKVDSRTILDQNGADKLVGRGDMLFLPPTSSHVLRAKGTFVSDEEISSVVEFIKDQQQADFYGETKLEEIPMVSSTSRATGHEDDLFEEAVDVILQTGRGSVSLLQRRLAIGYTRAAKLVDMMADRGILGPHKGSKAREINITFEGWERVKDGKANLKDVLDDDNQAA